MVDQTYLVAFKPPSQAIQHVIAATVEVHGEHLVFLNAEGKLAALFLMEIIQGWNVLPAADGALRALLAGHTAPLKRGRRSTMSAEGRARIAAAQKARWAAKKK